jgi:hypothetical protein
VTIMAHGLQWTPVTIMAQDKWVCIGQQWPSWHMVCSGHQWPSWHKTKGSALDTSNHHGTRFAVDTSDHHGTRFAVDTIDCHSSEHIKHSGSSAESACVWIKLYNRFLVYIFFIKLFEDDIESK